MTPEKKTPASQRRQAEGITGVSNTSRSVTPAPQWARKRVAESLLRFRGEYVSPESLHAQATLEAHTARSSRGGAQPGVALPSETASTEQTGAAGSPTSETPGTHPADPYLRAEWDRRVKWDLHEEALLPCRSLETTATGEEGKGVPKALSGPRKKVAATLTENIRYLCEKHGMERVAFFTLTFADHVTDPAEAQRRLHSLTAGVLDQRYPHRIRVFERQKSGRIHYHFVVVVPDDIRTGVDPDAIARGDYKTANAALRREWAFWHKTSKKYGFGRHNLQPVKSSHDALALYVGKYIGKGFQFRNEADKGVRLVSYSGDARHMTCKHTAVNKYSDQWRAKCLTFSRMVAKAKPHARIKCIEDLQFVLCKNWSYKHRDFILSLPPADLAVPF